jgi:galactonate dehydratase
MTRVAVQAIAPYFRRVSDKTVWSFVRVQSACGAVGWGEATVNGKAAEIAQAVALQNVRLAGTEADVMRGIVPLTPGRTGWAVASAIDQALWDILAQRDGKPLRDMLGESRRGDVEVYANINRGTLDRSPEGFAATAGAAAGAGFRAIKMAPFDGLTPELAPSAEGAALIRAGLDRIAAAHAAIAGRARLQVDCHWRFTPATAADALREATRIGITWFECPLPETEQNIGELRRLRGIANDGGVQLAGMEEASTLAAFLPWVDAYDVMMPDVKYAGGLREVLRIFDALRSHGVAVSLHNPTGSVCHAVSLHVTAAMPAGLPMEMQWAETELLYDLPPHKLPRPVGGRSPVPPGAGHGAALAFADLAATPPVE